MQMSSGNFCGVRLRSKSSPAFNLIESRYIADERSPKHSHANASLCMVLEGCFNETSADNSFVCKPSTVLFYPRHEEHSEHFYAPKSRCFLIEINWSWLAQIDQIETFIGRPAFFPSGRAPFLASGMYREFISADQCSEMAIQGMLLEMFVEISRNGKFKDTRTTPRFERVKEILHDQFQSHLTLSDISNETGLHPVYVAQAFRKIYGCTIGAYIRKLRLDYACKELVDKTISLSLISLNAGFYDQSHFTRTFKRHVGVTPAEFRRQMMKS